MSEIDLGSGDGGFPDGGGERPGDRESGVALGASEAKPWWNGGDQIRFHSKKVEPARVEVRYEATHDFRERIGRKLGIYLGRLRIFQM